MIDTEEEDWIDWARRSAVYFNEATWSDFKTGELRSISKKATQKRPSAEVIN